MIHVCMRMCKMNTQREINRPNMSQRRNSRTEPLPHALLNMHNNMLKTRRTCRPYRHVVPKMEWAVVVNWSLRRRDFLLAWRPGNRRHDRNDHTPTVQCSGLWLSVSRACRFAWMAPARVASKSSVSHGNEIAKILGQLRRCWARLVVFHRSSGSASVRPHIACADVMVVASPLPAVHRRPACLGMLVLDILMTCPVHRNCDWRHSCENTGWAKKVGRQTIILSNPNRFKKLLEYS